MSRENRAAGPWSGVAGWRQVWLVLTVVGLGLWHWIRRPYRLGRPRRPGPLWTRLRSSAGSAVYDAVISRFLRGYSELTRRRLHKQTGALVILLYRLMAAFDSEYERRVSHGGPMGFDEILGAETVRPHLDALSAFLAPYPQRHAIREFLESYASANYQRYLHLNRTAGERAGVTDHLEMIELDSGGFLICTAYVMAIFNDHQPPERVLREFAHLGVVGKLADDMVDVWADQRAGVINVLVGLVEQDRDEKQTMIRYAARPPRTGYRWWRRRCPRAFARFTDVLGFHRGQITAPSLRLAGDMMLLPAAWGGPATRPPDAVPAPPGPAPVSQPEASGVAAP